MNEKAKEFNDSTFEPVEENSTTESTQVDKPELDSKTEESTQVDSEELTAKLMAEKQQQVIDNDTKQYQYWQSEAYRSQNEIKRMQQEIENLRQKSQPQESKDEMPQKPTNDDPNEWLTYNAKMNEYNAKLIQSIITERQKELELKQQYEQQIQVRNQVVNRLSEVTKNPQKAEKILTFFGNTQNLQDPALYNVMYDAAQAYLNGTSKTREKFAPPPPIGGGETVQTNKTPDDVFNEKLGRENRYKL